jgi:uncharacterized membrane protein
MSKVSALTLATAVAGALALAASPVLAQTKGAAGFKCYGIAKAGQNDCANAAGTHSCAGQSKANYDLGEWKAVADKAACEKAGGSDKPGKGANPKVK